MTTYLDKRTPCPYQRQSPSSNLPSTGRNPDPAGRRDRHAGADDHGLDVGSRDPSLPATHALTAPSAPAEPGDWRPAVFSDLQHRVAGYPMVAIGGHPIVRTWCEGTAFYEADVRGGPASWQRLPFCEECVTRAGWTA